MKVLGISCYYHDAAACIMVDGKVVAAAEEERFTRKKHDANFPENAIEYCLREANLKIGDLDHVGFYEKPFIKFERILFTFFSTFPRSYPSFLNAVPKWLKERLWIRHTIQKELDWKRDVIFLDHHLSHAASTYLVSPFDRAAILTVDGVGEWTTASMGVGEGSQIKPIKEIRFPHSLGLLYSVFTAFLGFKVNDGEYKVMGLAPYGEPRYTDLIKKIIDIKQDGSFHLDMRYFAFQFGQKSYSKHFVKLFGRPRTPESPLEQRHKDMAASIQRVTEEIMLSLARHLHELTGEKRLCMAGGVAMNCVANGRIIRETPFEEVFIQPAATDAGGSVGAAAYITHSLMNIPRNGALESAYLGPSFSPSECRQALSSLGWDGETCDDSKLLTEVALALKEGKVVGWFQGRMELGPRALGNRSILASPVYPNMKHILNTKIKRRESFRPFAPSVLSEKCQDWFELNHPSPYMQFVCSVHEAVREKIPSVTHSDGSARVQTVTQGQAPRYWSLINTFEKETGIPIVINTSFNVRGEPIVCRPEEAIRCFETTEMDLLVLENTLVRKRRARHEPSRNRQGVLRIS